MKKTIGFVVLMLLSFVFNGNCQSTNVQAGLGGVKSEALYTKVYKVDTKVLARKVGDCEAAKKAKTSQEKLEIFLEQNGVLIVAPSKVSLDEKKGALFVKSSSANLDKVERLLQKIEKGNF